MSASRPESPRPDHKIMREPDRDRIGGASCLFQALAAPANQAAGLRRVDHVIFCQLIHREGKIEMKTSLWFIVSGLLSIPVLAALKAADPAPDFSAEASLAGKE